MRFRVQWSERAERLLAEIWLVAANRGELSRTIDRLDSEIGANPFAVGESRESDNFRICIRDEIGIEFVVYEKFSLAFVYGVFAVKGRRR